MTRLPTADKLAKLTLRAIAAYAERSSRRGASVLRGVVANEIIDEPLRLTTKLASARNLDWSDAVSIGHAGARVASASLTLTKRETLAALCLTRLVNVVMGVLGAAKNPADTGAIYVKDQLMIAATSAAAIPMCAARALDEPGATAALDAARRDYEILLKNFGEHENVVLGDLINLSHEWWQEQRAVG